LDFILNHATGQNQNQNPSIDAGIDEHVGVNPVVITPHPKVVIEEADPSVHIVVDFEPPIRGGAIHMQFP
jgi:hypothetical protein